MKLLKENKFMNKDNILKYLITILFILLPFLDMLRTTFIKDIELFNISIIELVNIILIGGSLLITVIKIFKTRKKDVFALILFICAIIVYIILHYKNIIKFDTTIFSKANFNFITETFYIGRVYILPLLLLFVLIENKKIFNKEFYFRISKIVIAIISFSILFLNVFKISYISYSATHDFVSNNMFDYFLYNGDFKLLASRGWFDSANELSAVLLLLLPFNIIMLYKEKKKFNIVLLVSQILAMIILGTRVAAFGACAVCAFSIVCYVMIKLIKKESVNCSFVETFGLIIMACTAYLSISPTMIARISDGFYDFSVKSEEAYEDLEKLDEIDDPKQLDELFQKYSDEYKVNPEFLKLYPIDNDLEFWTSIFKRDKALNNNSRILKTDIIKRIEQRNNNEIDKYLGIGYTLNFMDIERDYVYQYYLFGIVGIVLLILPYIILLLINGGKALFNFNSNFNFKTLLAFMSPALILVVAYLSGHVFGWVSPMLFLSMTLGMLTVTVSDNNKKKGNIK